MFQSIILAATLVASTFAQTSVVTSSASRVTATATQSMPAAATQGFNGANVTRTTALSWCRAQINTCPDICGGRVSANSCDEVTFTYNCVCSNGTVPDCTAFQQTLPFYICEATYAQCLDLHPSTDPAGQQQCIDNRRCGTRNATAERALASSTTSASGSATSASASAASATSSGVAAMSISPIANGAFVAVLLALAKFVL